jgi:hypothetical protein
MSNGRLTILVAAVALSGCAVGDLQDGDVGQTEEAGVYCMTCGFNGMRKRAANYMPGKLGLGNLRNLGAATSQGVVPLCGGSFNSNGICPLHPGWDNWLRTDTSNTAWEILTYLVKTAAPDHLGVRSTNGVVYRGEVGLAPAALTQTFAAREEQLVTAGLLAYLNLNTGVSTCFRTKDAPGACPSGEGWNYEELVAYGNVFRGTTSTNVDWYVAGGRKGNGLYWSPAANKRVCGTDAAVTCEVGLNTYTSSDHHCDFQGNTNIGTRAPRSCSAQNGKTFANPVSVFLAAVPAMLPGDHPRPVHQIAY